MTAFAHVDFPVQHPGVARAERTLEFVAPALRALAALGAPLVRAYEGWVARRREARSDARYWNAALGDARSMADISRAMDQEARDVKASWPAHGLIFRSPALSQAFSVAFPALLWLLRRLPASLREVLDAWVARDARRRAERRREAAARR